MLRYRMPSSLSYVPCFSVLNRLVNDCSGEIFYNWKRKKPRLEPSAWFLGFSLCFFWLKEAWTKAVDTFLLNLVYKSCFDGKTEFAMMKTVFFLMDLVSFLIHF
jgi:hypothetical protein